VRLPDGRRLAASRGATLLDVLEGGGLPIEAGCRMGLCGSDPVVVADGGDGLSPPGADERATLARLGAPPGARLACCARLLGPVSISLGRGAADRPAPVSVSPRAPRRVVVIGNGIAGVTAAEGIRQGDPGCTIDVVAREGHHLYDRMAIGRLIYGHTGLQPLTLKPAAWYDDQRVTAWLNTRAAAIDRDGRRVILGTGESLSYDRLILATGSRSAVPPLDGFDRPGCFVLREADDAQRLRAFVQEPSSRRAVVAGGGVLGVEASYALTRLGLDVTVLEVGDHLLRRQLDARAAAILADHLEGLGVRVVVGARVGALLGEEAVSGVVLGDGGTVAADLVLVAAGVTPNADLARAAGLEVGLGVVVDDRMRTSDPDILAAGDVAEHGGVVSGHWAAAVDQARVAAANALGGDGRYRARPAVTTLKVPGIYLTSIGRVAGADGETCIVLDESGRARYAKLFVRGERIVGAILVGHPLEAPALAAAVEDGRDASALLERLGAGDWSVVAPSGDEPALVCTNPG
jgi:NAD(P)H-nitrite reductase large subunit/ferredoxin